jgi:hypothetical protein
LFAPALFALALIAAAASASAQTNESPEQNVKASQQYQSLTCSNPAFRKNRIEKECGPLQGSQFYDSCVASFDCGRQPSAADWRKAPASETTR